MVIIFGAIFGYLIAFRERSQMKRYSPEGLEIKKSRIKKIPLAIVWNAANSFDMFVPQLKDGLLHLTHKDHNYGVVFDPEAETDIMQHAGDLRVFNAFVDHTEAVTAAQVKAISDLSKTKYEKDVDIEEEKWWEILRMSEQELRNNAELLGIEREEELQEILKFKMDEIENKPITDGVFSFQEAMKVLNPAHSAGHLLNLQSAWFKKGAAGLWDEMKWRIIIIAAVAFAIIAVAAALAFTMIKG